jgi:tetratricopeptide (TPR) repeat protein
VAHSYNNLAMVYRAQDKYEEALEMLPKSLEIKTRVYDSDKQAWPMTERERERGERERERWP